MSYEMNPFKKLEKTTGAKYHSVYPEDRTIQLYLAVCWMFENQTFLCVCVCVCVCLCLWFHTCDTANTCACKFCK